ncbi:MAG: hypothetical protein COA67_05795 [Lutibacter sp.]|nr:MAG: hypothetical protein COA67_05795 [Lutibacter sp.]
MNPILKNILAVIAGFLGGSIINMGLIKIGHSLLPIEGLDPNDMIALAEVMPTLEPKYFIFPFLAHALGTLVGAFVAYKVAATHKMKFALGIGAFFLIGGIMMSQMLPAPTWFTIVDVALAYIPMAWIGGKLAEK